MELFPSARNIQGSMVITISNRRYREKITLQSVDHMLLTLRQPVFSCIALEPRSVDDTLPWALLLHCNAICLDINVFTRFIYQTCNPLHER